MPEKLTAEEAVNQILECKVEVWNEIRAIKEDLEAGDSRMSHIESILDKHETQRSAYAVELKQAVKELRSELSSYRNDFNNHDVVEMKKYDQIIKALTELKDEITTTKEETDHNSKVLADKAAQDKEDKAVFDAITERDKPYKELKVKMLYIVLTAIVGGALAGLWSLISFVVELQTLITGG